MNSFFSTFKQGIATKTFSNPITEDVTGTNGAAEAGVRREIVIAISSIITLILLVAIVFMFIKCRKYQQRHHSSKLCTAPNKIDSSALYTTSTLNSSGGYGTANRRSAGSRMDMNGGFEPRLTRGKSTESSSIDYNLVGGVLPPPDTSAATLSRLGSPLMNDRLPHLHSNGGTLNSRILGPNGDVSNGVIHPQRFSDSQSWLDGSSRSRDTSPASSIPPGMPAFRVIPLCNGETPNGVADQPINDPFAGTTTFPNPSLTPLTPRGSSTLGSDVGSNPSVMRQSADSNDPWEANRTQNGNAPLLRRNQYWV